MRECLLSSRLTSLLLALALSSKRFLAVSNHLKVESALHEQLAAIGINAIKPVFSSVKRLGGAAASEPDFKSAAPTPAVPSVYSSMAAASNQQQSQSQQPLQPQLPRVSSSVVSPQAALGLRSTISVLFYFETQSREEKRETAKSEFRANIHKWLKIMVHLQPSLSTSESFSRPG